MICLYCSDEPTDRVMTHTLRIEVFEFEDTRLTAFGASTAGA